MKIKRSDWEEMVAHAREEAPNECCGYLSARDGVVTKVVRSQNLRASPYGYELDPPSLLAANELDDDGFDVAVYHSHPKSAPVPSEQDRNVAMYPHWLNLIVSLDGEPEVRAWWIRERDVEEEPVEIG